MIDDGNREGLGIELDLSLPSERAARALDQITEWRGSLSRSAMIMVRDTSVPS